MSVRTRSDRRGLPAATAGIPAPADRRFRRRGDVRPGRHRRLGQLAWQVARRLFGVGLVAGLGFWTASWLLGSGVLRVNRIVVRGNVWLSAAEVEAMIDGLRGDSILRVSFDEYRTRVMDSPWVAGVSLWRVLPSTVEVRVVERTPMAIARLGHMLYLVDETGVIIDEFGPQYREFDLPIVDGLVSSPAPSGPLVDADRVRLTARLLDALDARADLRQRLSQVDVSNVHDAIVLLDDDPVFLHLGEDRFVERLQSYLELGPTLKERLVSIDYVDLRFDERVYVGSRKQNAGVAR